MQKRCKRTWNNITSIHGILVFDEAEAIHQLHLGDFPGAMGRKMGLDIGLGSCKSSEKKSSQWELESQASAR